MSDIVETLKNITATKGRDHRSGKEFIRLDDTQAAVDAIATAHDEITRLRRELAEARDKALEEAAKVADDEAGGRRWQKSDAGAQNDKRAARDFETMMIEAIHIAAAIRSLKEKAE